MITGKGYSCQSSIVHGPFQHVNIFRIPRHLIHPPVPQHHPDRGASLAIGSEIRQAVIFREALIVGRLADAAGYVHIPQRHVIPQAVQCTDIALVVSVGCHVCHAAIKVHGTHGMPCDVRHLGDRLFVLVI